MIIEDKTQPEDVYSFARFKHNQIFNIKTEQRSAQNNTYESMCTDNERVCS